MQAQIVLVSLELPSYRDLKSENGNFFVRRKIVTPLCNREIVNYSLVLRLVSVGILGLQVVKIYECLKVCVY